jgi:hypothetical protein
MQRSFRLVDQTVLNRLVAARHLIESSGPLPTSSAPALLVAQKLLIAHDAAELVFLALLSFSKAVALGKDGQIIKDPSFMQMAQALLNYANVNYHLEERSQIKVFEDLTETRKLFKHRGVLVDPISNAHLFGSAVSALDELCSSILGQPLLRIDQTSAIASNLIRASFSSAREAIDLSNFKSSLEYTSRGLAIAFWEMAVPASITAGKPSSDEALLLSGRGIDPASFLLMQRLLPVAYFHHDEPDWNLRKFGHEANWSSHIAEFCLGTAIDAVIKLQSAPEKPIATEFYEVYEDVVKIDAEKPEVYWAKGGGLYSFHFSDEQKTDVFKAGDKIFGHATGRWERNVRLTLEGEVDFEYATWISIERPRTERMEFTGESWNTHVIWLKREEVEISHQIDAEKAKMRELLRQQYEADSDLDV